MEPITREEYYLAKIAGTYKGKTPKPVTRSQYYMAKVAGVWGGSIPAPVTRLEYYWAAIANGEGEVFPPVTREEHFLTLVADAYSVVLTVVTGNPALLEGVKGNRFTSLTLHGKSTQRSTTGANILNDTYLSLCKGSVDLFTANGLFTANSNYEKNVEFNLLFTEGSIFADSIKDEETYYIAFRPIGFTPVYRFQLSLKNGAHETIATSVGAIVASVSGATLKKTARIQLYFFNVSGAIPIISGSRFQMIFSKKPDCIYEPYTGGKPSPSPEYPQEIENAGQSGDIGVDVYGGNLFDKSTAIFGGVVDKDNGNIAYNERYACSDYIAIPRGISFLYQTGGALNQRAFYDAGKIYISAAENTNKINIPTNARYIRITSAIDKQDMSDIMLNIGSTALTYEPYKPAQTLIIPTPNGLPGIPVSSDGNYTDADGRQWVCDEVDFKKGVYAQRIGKRTITSKDVFNKSGMSTDDVNYFALGNFSLHIGTIGEKDVLMSNCFVAGINHGFGAWGKIFLSSAFDDKVYFSVEAQKYPDEETFKQWAVENGLMFLYQLVDIIETPLAAEELSAYKTLCTYSPTTTVINDADAWMSVGYAKMK